MTDPHEDIGVYAEQFATFEEAEAALKRFVDQHGDDLSEVETLVVTTVARHVTEDGRTYLIHEEVNGDRFFAECLKSVSGAIPCEHGVTNVDIPVPVWDDECESLAEAQRACEIHDLAWAMAEIEVGNDTGE